MFIGLKFDYYLNYPSLSSQPAYFSFSSLQSPYSLFFLIIVLDSTVICEDQNRLDDLFF